MSRDGRHGGHRNSYGTLRSPRRDPLGERPLREDRRGAARAAAARAASRYAGAGWQGSDAYEGRGSHVADHRRDDSRGRDEGHRWGYAAPGRAAPLRAHYAGRSRSRSRWSPRGSQVSGYLSGQLAFRQGGYQQRARALPAPPPPPPQRRPEEELSVHSSGSYSSEASGVKKKSGGASNKDEIVHFHWERGQLLHRRYELIERLGDGTFGRVVLAHDGLEDRQVAIKIIRDVKRYMENAKIEAGILKNIHRADPHGSFRCAIMYDTFMHSSRYFCLVFEPLGESLFDFMKKNNYRGFWVQDIQSYARQCLKALKFLHKTLRMTHTDLKPENILLQSTGDCRTSFFPREAAWQETHGSSNSRSGGSSQYLRPATSQIKVIDFGNATYEGEHHSSVINTRQYRGPEVVLELGWNSRSDLWSLGCIFMELYSGELLFGTHENLEHLAMMERVQGPLPEAMLAGASKSVQEKYLSRSGRGGSCRLRWPECASSPSSQRHVERQPPIRSRVEDHHRHLAHWIAEMLTHDPARRPSASEASRHEFFDVFYDD